MRDLSGELRANSVSGSILGEHLCGLMWLESVSGEINLQDCDLQFVRGSSVSGSVTMNIPLGEGPYRFNTVSGRMRLALPPEAGCTIRAKSLSGRLRTALPITRRQRKGGQVLAEIRGGGPEVHYQSVSGSLTVV
jgi:hypothetical protein